MNPTYGVRLYNTLMLYVVKHGDIARRFDQAFEYSCSVFGIVFHVGPILIALMSHIYLP